MKSNCFGVQKSNSKHYVAKSTFWHSRQPLSRSLAMSLGRPTRLFRHCNCPQRRLAVKTFVSAFLMELFAKPFIVNSSEVDKSFSCIMKWKPCWTCKKTPWFIARSAYWYTWPNAWTRARTSHAYQTVFQLLLCSTIIETGIDIPNANTMLINRADRFGLAITSITRTSRALTSPSYAYLLTNNESQTPQAKTTRSHSTHTI